MFSKKATFASLLAAKCQNAQFRPRQSRLQCNLEFPGRPDVNRFRWDWGRPVSSSYPELNMRTKAPAAFFSKEVTLCLEASMEDDVAQAQRKRVCTTSRSPRPALGSCAQLLWHRQNGRAAFFRPL